MWLCILRRWPTRYQASKLIKDLHVKEGQMGENPKDQAMAFATRALQRPLPTPRREKKLQAGKNKNAPYLPGIVNLQVLGTGANGAPSSVYLFTDQSRYLFNCGEGTQRLAHEHKTKLTRLEQIFVTRNTWHTVGGFPGLALTVQDAGVKELTIHGPPHFDNILQSMRRFVVLKNLQVKTKDYTAAGDFEDAVISVKCLPLWSEDCKKLVNVYVCKLKPRPGALNLEKCVDRGVPPGPLLGQLKSGMDVTLENGTVVKSIDVCEPSEPELSIIFLDLPSLEFLKSLQNLLANLPDESLYSSTAVVHFTSDSIVQHEAYQEMLSRFSPDTDHIYLNSITNAFSGYVAAHRIQYQLNQLNPRVFPILAEATQLLRSNSIGITNKLKKTKLIEGAHAEEVDDKEQSDTTDKNPRSINAMTNFHLRPRKGFEDTIDAKFCPSTYLEETKKLQEFPILLENLRSILPTITSDQADYPKITFLGTGSCVPNKTRNVSAILMQLNELSYILLDCGEGTFGQIVRFFGQSQATEVIRNLKAIYISHLHADHHIGLIGLLSEVNRIMAEGRKDPVLLFAPKQIQPWLNFYNGNIEEINNAYKLIGNNEMLENSLDLSISHGDIGFTSVATCLVRHCPHSFGVSLTLPITYNGKPMKITYSGDTMPCPDLVQLGLNSTILIHEATMEDDLTEEAKIKMHSTISQAIEQGNAMNADHIILTHFSQRYAKLPRLPRIDGETETMRNIAIAFDNMQVTPADLPHFHLMYPALKALFAEHTEVLEQKALKREMKAERKRKLTNED